MRMNSSNFLPTVAIHNIQGNHRKSRIFRNNIHRAMANRTDVVCLTFYILSFHRFFALNLDEPNGNIYLMAAFLESTVWYRRYLWTFSRICFSLLSRRQRKVIRARFVYAHAQLLSLCCVISLISSSCFLSL